MYVLHASFCAISLNKTQDLRFLKNSGKIMTTPPPACYACKNYINEIFQSKYIAWKTVRFHSIECETETLQEFSGKRKSSDLYRARSTQIASLLFPMTHILYIKFYTISSTRNRDQFTPKNPEKV